METNKQTIKTGIKTMKHELFITRKTTKENNNHFIINEKHAEDFNSGVAIDIISSCTMIMNEFNDFKNNKKSYYSSIIIDNEAILKIAEIIKNKQ